MLDDAPDLRPGDTGEWVVELQRLLQGHDPSVEMSGTFDDATTGAVRQLRYSQDLEPGDEVNWVIWRILRGIPLQEQDPEAAPEAPSVWRVNAAQNDWGSIDLVIENDSPYAVPSRSRHVDIPFSCRGELQTQQGHAVDLPDEDLAPGAFTTARIPIDHMRPDHGHLEAGDPAMLRFHFPDVVGGFVYRCEFVAVEGGYLQLTGAWQE